MSRETEIALALDLPSSDEACIALERVGDAVEWIKVGLQQFCREGPGWVAELGDSGYRVFLDLKLHDIPNTVASAVAALAGLPVGLLTVHASGGSAMLRAAVEARNQFLPLCRVVAVTVLTSLDDADLAAAGVAGSAGEQVLRLADLAISSGVDGVVCSPLEISVLRNRFGPEPWLVTPGIRPPGVSPDEQKRVMSPVEARDLGADLLVIGRPILQAPDPAEAAWAIRKSLQRS